nr:MAG TPA: hypothetical protein [Caudoviricetes sp.]
MPLFCGWAAPVVVTGAVSFRLCSSVSRFTIKFVFLSCFKDSNLVHLNYRGGEEKPR